MDMTKVKQDCPCCGQDMTGALWQTEDGRYLWAFNWVGGGFNDVWALDKDDAVKVAAEKFSGMEIQRSSLRALTNEQWHERNRMTNMYYD